MRRGPTLLVIGGLAALIGWVLWPAEGPPERSDAEAPTAAPPARRGPRVLRPPVAGAPCEVRGVVEGGRASQVSLHSSRAGVDVPAQLLAEGRRFQGTLPEQGPIEVVVRAPDGRSASASARCDGLGAVEVTVRLPAAEDLGTRLAGRCIYLETGVAVADARVVARAVADGDAALAGLTDDEGRFDLPAPAGVYRVRCGKDGDESAAARVTLEPGVSAQLELLLAARASVAGTARDAQGVLPGLTVRGRPARQGVDGREVHAVTDLEGRFLLVGLPPGPVVVDAQDGGRFAEGHAVARVDLPYAEVELMLEDSGVVVEGFVTADGAGVEGVTVAVTTIRDARGRPPRARLRRAARTDEDGGYAVGGLAPGRVRVEAQAPGRVPASAEVMLPLGRTRVDLGLPAACETPIRVVPETPSRPVFVRVFRKGQADVRASGRTGAPIVVTAAPGPAVISVRSAGRTVATATLSAELCAGPLTLDLSPPEGRGALEITTVSPTRAPVGGVRVWLDAPGGMATTGEDGRVLFEGLEPRRYRVGTRDAETLEVEVRAGATTRAELEVSRGEGDIAGTVEAAGAPVEGAAILAACADSGRPPDLSRARVRARSRADGAFDFVPDDGGVCLVRAEHRSRGRSEPVLLRVGEESGRIELLAASSVSGQVSRATDRTPVTSYTLSVRVQGAAAGVEGRTLQISAEDGAFEVEDLAAGRVALAVSGPAGRARREITLGPGERRDGVDLVVFDQGRVSGRVVDADGQPLAGARVRIEALRRPLGRARTGADGRFSFSVPAGDPLRVYASAPGHYPRGTEAFDLDAEGAKTVPDIVLEARGGPEEKEGGIGIMFSGTDSGIRVIRFTEDSPAREAGLLEGDLITAIDGVPFGRDPLVNWVVTLRGLAGTPVVLEIERGTQAPFSATVIRRAIGLEAVPDDAP